MDDKRSNHTVYNVNYYFVWGLKYRHAVLEPIEDWLETCFRDVCDEYEFETPSLYVSPDYVHLFLSAHPNHAPSEIGRTVKGITAWEMWEQLEPILEDHSWGNEL